jgi:hypothetical protein
MVINWLAELASPRWLIAIRLHWRRYPRFGYVLVQVMITCGASFLMRTSATLPPADARHATVKTAEST